MQRRTQHLRPAILHLPLLLLSISLRVSACPEIPPICGLSAAEFREKYPWPITADERAAIGRYQGRSFIAINVYLRSGDESLFSRFIPSLYPSRDALLNDIKLVDEAIAKAPIAPCAVTLWRGETFDKTRALNKVDQPQSTQSFSSMSLNRATSVGFAAVENYPTTIYKNRDAQGVLEEITIPPGQQAATARQHSGAQLRRGRGATAKKF